MDLPNKDYRYFLFFITLFSCLIPYGLVSGPFLPDLFLTISSILFIYMVFKLKKMEYFFSIFFIISFIWYLYLVLNSLISDDFLFSLESSLFYIRFPVFVLTICFIIEYNHRFIELFYYFLLSIFIILIFDSLFQYLIGYNLLGWTNDELNSHINGERLSGMFGDDYILGSFLARLLPLLCALHFLLCKKNIFLNILIFFTSVVIFLTGERTALLLNLIFLFFLFFINFKKITSNLFLILIIFATFITFLIFDEGKRERILKHTVNQIEELIDDKQLNSVNDSHADNKIFSNPHLRHYVSAYFMFIEKPIFGHGPKMYRKLCKQEEYIKYAGCSSHPHNTYMQLLTETGIFGFLFFISILIYILYKFSIIFINKEIKDNNKKYKLLLITSLILTLFPFLPSGSVFNNWLNVIYFLPIGFLIAKRYN